MLRFITILALIAGVALALAAALVEGSGVDGTAGAVLAVIGTLAALVGVLVLDASRLSRRTRTAIGLLALLAAALSALAAWFLMQNILAAAMVLACLGILALVARPQPLAQPLART